MSVLHIDIETHSSVDLLKSGVYRYVEAPDFGILLLAYAFDDEAVQIIEPKAEADKLVICDLPVKLRKALTNPTVTKIAHNANFERTCISKAFSITCAPEQWRCTSVLALMAGLPSSLDGAAKALNLTGKNQTGTMLINYFSKPCKPTKTNGLRTRNLPEHNPEKWEQFKEYCIQDVAVERTLCGALYAFSHPAFEKRLWDLDQKINDIGVRVDAVLIEHAINCDRLLSDQLMQQAKDLSGLDNPNSVAQIKSWLKSQGEDVSSLNKDSIPDILNNTDNETVHDVLNLRLQMSKASIKKYTTMDAARCADDRVRGLLQFYGANRTGRWAGRLVQVQNLKRNYLPDLDLARKTLLSGDYEMLELLYGDVPDVLSQLVRTAFIPSDGNQFIVADFSAIEARVIAWLAGETWRLDVFASHGKIYEASASQMFGIPMDKIDKELRQKGKVAELALGYQGGAGALIAMGALDMGLTEDELPELVAVWRASNAEIVRLWRDVSSFANKAILYKIPLDFRYGMRFEYVNNNLHIRLPSGRCLIYQDAKVDYTTPWHSRITYMGVNQTSRKWERVETYGGKLVENIIQAIARDCLAEALIRLDESAYNTVMHIHDEVVIDAPKGTLTENVIDLITQPIKWANGLVLAAEAFTCDYYMKD